MSAKKRVCPYTPDELRKKYEEQELSTVKIAAEAGVSNQTVAVWLREAGIAVRRGGLQRSNKFPFPGKLWLHEHHWDKGWSLGKIGTRWAILVGRDTAYSASTVTTWMKGNEVPIRPVWNGLTMFNKSPQGREKARQNMIKLHENGKSGRATDDQMRKIGRDQARKQIAARETRICCLAGCNVSVTRKKSHFTMANWYCCKSHAGKSNQILRRQREHDAMLERMQQNADALALNARNDARAQLGLSPELEVSR